MNRYRKKTLNEKYPFLKKNDSGTGNWTGGGSLRLGGANAVLLTIATAPNTYPHYWLKIQLRKIRDRGELFQLAKYCLQKKAPIINIIKNGEKQVAFFYNW